MAFCRSNATFYARRLPSNGFSLIELVVVIAILGVLTSLALPIFSNIRKDAQINQAKNTLATIVKECSIALLRSQGGQVELSAIKSANASLSGYEIVSLSNSKPGLGSCVKNTNAAGDPGSYITIEALPSIYVDGNRVSEIPSFLIEFNYATGETKKTCYKEKVTKYGAGCEQDTDGKKVCAGGKCFFVPNETLGSWD